MPKAIQEPMSDQEIEAKFLRLAEPVMDGPRQTELESALASGRYEERARILHLFVLDPTV